MSGYDYYNESKHTPEEHIETHYVLSVNSSYMGFYKYELVAVAPTRSP
jgi:hypothetical protein